MYKSLMMMTFYWWVVISICFIMFSILATSKTSFQLVDNWIIMLYELLSQVKNLLE